MTGAIAVERGSWGVGNQFLHGQRQHCLRIDSIRQSYPQVETAIGFGGVQFRQKLVHRTESRIFTIAINPAEGVDLPLPIAVGQIFANHHLGERAWAQNSRLLRQNQLVANGRGSQNVANPEAWRQNLGERSQIDDPLFVHRPKSIRNRLIEVQKSVRIVLQNQNVVSLTDFKNLRTTFLGQSHTGRVSKIRDQVEELDGSPGFFEAIDGLLQRFRAHSVMVCVNMLNVCLIVAENPQGANITRAFGQNHVAFVDEKAAQQLQTVLRTSGHYDIFNRRTYAF